jgi:hypothetical protein
MKDEISLRAAGYVQVSPGVWERPKFLPPGNDGPDCVHTPVDAEGDLHEAIENYCKYRGWPIVHSRMDMPTTTAKGVTDFIIYADAGRVFNIECKAGKKKQSTDQKGWQLALEMNGHRYHLVRSFEEFTAIVTANTK